jgi:hypothetical protein
MPERSAASFIEAFLRHLECQASIPKVQIERAVGPIIGMFIPSVLSEYFHKTFKMVCAEFPLRNGQPTDEKRPYLSSNIDWLLYNVDDDQLEFVELKIAAVFEPKQAERYLEVIRGIREHGSSFLLKDHHGIRNASRKKAKYDKALLSREDDELFDRVFSDRLKRARLVYIAPTALEVRIGAALDSHATCLTFQQLPKQITHPFPKVWKVVRDMLVRLEQPVG